MRLVIYRGPEAPLSGAGVQIASGTGSTASVLRGPGPRPPPLQQLPASRVGMRKGSCPSQGEAFTHSGPPYSVLGSLEAEIEH